MNRKRDSKCAVPDRTSSGSCFEASKSALAQSAVRVVRLPSWTTLSRVGCSEGPQPFRALEQH